METENLRDEPKYVLRRVGSNALIATDMSLADYAAALGQRADQIAKEDPLVPPARVVEMLREVPLPPEAEPLGDARLVRLAAAASQAAAISSKQEIYPRNMDAGRAIKLSHGGLVGVRFLTPEQIRQRVSSRYPLAAALPGRPQLDKLLADAGLELAWNPDHPGGGAYVSTARNVLSVSDVSSTVPRYSTGARTSGTPAANFLPAYVPPEVAEARAFEERLRYAERHGSFLALTVKMNLYERARQELTTRFATRPLDLERVFLDALRQAADEVGADWTVVVNADAADRRSEDWRNLNHLIASTVIPQVEQAARQVLRGEQDGADVSPELAGALRPGGHALADGPGGAGRPPARRVAVDSGQPADRDAAAGRRGRPGDHQQPMGAHPGKLVPEPAPVFGNGSNTKARRDEQGAE